MPRPPGIWGGGWRLVEVGKRQGHQGPQGHQGRQAKKKTVLRDVLEVLAVLDVLEVLAVLDVLEVLVNLPQPPHPHPQLVAQPVRMPGGHDGPRIAEAAAQEAEVAGGGGGGFGAEGAGWPDALSDGDHGKTLAAGEPVVEQTLPGLRFRTAGAQADPVSRQQAASEVEAAVGGEPGGEVERGFDLPAVFVRRADRGRRLSRDSFQIP